MWWSLLWACRVECPSEVVGGDAAQRERVAEAVDVFRDLLDPSLTLCVPKVTLDARTSDDGHVGTYKVHTRRVELLPEATDLVVFHELCHAIQHQNDIELLPTWEVDPGFATVYGLDGKPERQASEGFAHACSIGPTWSVTLGGTCPLDPTDLDPLREGAALFVGFDERLVDVDRQVPYQEVLRIPVAPGAEVELLPDVGVRISVDGESYDLALPEGTPLRGAEEAVALQGIGASEEGGAVRMFFLDSPDGARALRRLWDEDGRISPLGCWHPEERLFTYRGAPWTTYRDGPDLVFGTWQGSGSAL